MCMTIMAHCHMQQLAGDRLWSLPHQGLDRVFNGGISDGLAMLLLNLLPKGKHLLKPQKLILESGVKKMH